MNKFSYLLIIPSFACILFSCKKADVAGGKVQNAALIVGTWKSYQQDTKIYDLETNDLLKDTVITYKAANVGLAGYNIFNSDGSAYITTLPYKKTGATVATIDTTSYLQYTLIGSSLTLKQNIGGSETDPIISITDSDLVLEKMYLSTPATGMGLDVNTSYKFVVDTFFTKQ